MYCHMCHYNLLLVFNRDVCAGILKYRDNVKNFHRNRNLDGFLLCKCIIVLVFFF